MEWGTFYERTAVEAGGQLDGWREDKIEETSLLRSVMLDHLELCRKYWENLFENGSFFCLFFSNAIKDQGIIEIGHAWVNLIPFPLMKLLSKLSHTQNIAALHANNRDPQG